MFILNRPFVSDLLIETIKNNSYTVLENAESVRYFSGYNFLLNDIAAVAEAKKDSGFKLYVNSEDAIEWICRNLSFSPIPEKINLFKDKVKFRDLLKPLYPDFYYREIMLDNLKTTDSRTLKYPFILKPAVGFLSFGVYPVKDENDFNAVIERLDSDIANFKDVFPKEVVNASKFIIEEMINGEEYAIDAYYNSDGEPVILNIYYHPFFDANDVSDRVYYTSKKIIQNHINIFNDLLIKIGKAANLKNFPMHLELRTDGKNIVPIEINPMRFAGWCDTDLAYYAYGINIYEYYMQDKKPDWDKIFENKNDEMYYFTGAEVPVNIEKAKIKSFDYERYLSNIKNPLEIRKVDYKNKPLFAVVFGQTSDINEIKTLLSMDINKYIEI